MVNWVLASHNRRRSLIRVHLLQTRAGDKSRAAPGFSSAIDFLDSVGNGSIGWEFGPETPLQLLAQLGNFHSLHDNELTAQHFPGLIVIGQLAGNAAILAILIPAKTAVGNRFRADELEASEKRIALRHLKLLAHHGDVHELFIRAKGFRHDQSCLPWTGCRVSAEVARDGSL